MSIQFPGSVLSRALRSRLIQQRLSKANTHSLPRSAALITSRLHSTVNAAADQTVSNHEHETATRAQPAHNVHNRGRRQFAAVEDPETPLKKKWKEEGAMLMAIASASGNRGISSRAIELEMKWLEDPRALADRVAQMLQAGYPAKAVALVRQAQKNGQSCEVAWNHLLRHCMARGHSKAAFKFYNDMKKRGRMPSERTYTIMLKGFSEAPQSRGLVETAYNIYRSISAPNSEIDLDIIHTNAMLTVCQRHGDMDMLWRIAGDLPEEGLRAPNMITYSIILRALQNAARSDIERLDDSEIDSIIERKEQLVKEGKRIWADIVYRWTKGGIPVDNSVVASMARLLMEGAHDRDFYHVFELYHQTMGIPILAKVPPENLKASRRRVTFQKTFKSPSAEEPEDVPFVDENNKRMRHQEEPLPDIDDEENFDSLFEPVVPNSDTLVFVQPGNMELTMLLDACLNMTQGTSTGTAYWDHLTRESTDYRIEPDQVSFYQYLRVLRLTHSSKLVVRLVEEQMLPLGHVTEKAIHIALSCCRRDRRNPQVLAHANKLLDFMHQGVILPSPRVLEGYMTLVQRLSLDPHALLYLEGLGTKPKRSRAYLQTMAKEVQAKLRLRATQALWPLISQLHEAMMHGKPAPKTRWSSVGGADGVMYGSECVKVMAWVRTMIDEALKPVYADYISGDRRFLKSSSDMLKTYSDKATIEKFANRIVYPTTEQRHEYNERRRERNWTKRGTQNDVNEVTDESSGVIQESFEGNETPLKTEATSSGVDEILHDSQAEENPPRPEVDSPEVDEGQPERQADSSSQGDIKH